MAIQVYAQEEITNNLISAHIVYDFRRSHVDAFVAAIDASDFKGIFESENIDEMVEILNRNLQAALINIHKNQYL